MTDAESSDETAEAPVQGGSGSQGLLWALGIAGLFIGFVLSVSEGSAVLAGAFLNIGGLGVLLALVVQAIRAALRK